MSLFHYTSAEAIHSILSNKKIRLTDIRFLNDSQEFHDGIRCLYDALISPMPSLFSDRVYIKKAEEYLRSSLEESTKYGLDSEPIFICSFSRAANLLSQWRAYGSYSLEFDEEELRKTKLNLVPCLYDPIIKRKTADPAVLNSLRDISLSMGKNEGCIGTDALDSIGKIVSLAATFKHDGFLEEQEIRVVTRKSEDCDSINYIPRGSRLVPYSEESIPLDCVKAIHIGPMKDQDLSFISMSAFARKITKSWIEESGNTEYHLEVKKSPIPYREK